MIDILHVIISISFGVFVVKFRNQCSVYFHVLVRWGLGRDGAKIRALQYCSALTHWGQVTHICVSKLTIIGSDNGLSPGRRQAIIWTNTWILLIGPSGTKFNEIVFEIHTFSFKKMHLKMSSAKWCPFCLGPNVLIWVSWHTCKCSCLYRCLGHCIPFFLLNEVLEEIYSRFMAEKDGLSHSDVRKVDSNSIMGIHVYRKWDFWFINSVPSSTNAPILCVLQWVLQSWAEWESSEPCCAIPEL